MKRVELTKELIQKIKPNAEIVFYANMKDENGKPILLELTVKSIGMTADVDEPNVGGIVFDANKL